MKHFTSRSPCLTETHSPWRGDFSSRAFAQSWADRLTVIKQTIPMITFASFIDSEFKTSRLLVRLVGRFCRFEVYCLARIIRWRIESEQQGTVPFGRHV